MHIFRPQRYETRNQPQEKIWKDNKYLETEEMLLKNEWAYQEAKEEIKRSWKPDKTIIPQPKTSETQERQS